MNLLIILFLLFSPGAVLFYLVNKEQYTLFEGVVYSIVLSLSYYISGFWFLKFASIPFTVFIYCTFIATFIFVLLSLKRFKLPKVRLEDVTMFIFVLFLGLIFFRLSNFAVPSGADMATQSYISRLIIENDSFLQSYEPILPTDDFGSYPIGFPVISASVSLLTGIPAYQTSLLLTIFTYILFGISLFLFLKNYFSQTISFLVCLIVFFAGFGVLGYLVWGGNTTILAISFLAIFFNLFLKLSSNARPSLASLATLALILYASFSIHQVPSVIFFYLLCPFIIFAVISKSLRRRAIFSISRLGVFLFILALPFLVSLKIPNQEVLEWVRLWQSNAWPGNLANSYLTIPSYLRQTLDNAVFLLFIFGLLASLLIRVKHKEWFFASILMIFIVIFNSNRWFLPLSPLLYPDRTVTVALFPIAFFVGCGILFLEKTLTRILKKRFLVISALVIFALGLPLDGKNLGKIYVSNFEKAQFYIASSVSVTEEDLKVMTYIAENTNPNDIILNNYGDAGIWIPAIAFRTISNPDLPPHDLGARQVLGAKKADYLFIGAKTVYPDVSYRPDQVNADPKYELVYSWGNSYLYKVKQ